jgi:hypothetical protein
MPGGLLQLVAYGLQDFILTGDPQITFFKKAYRRNTLFSSEILKLKFSGDQDFDKTSICKIPNNGDLLGKSVLQIDLPTISCYQIKENSNTINVDNTCEENQILKKIKLLNKFLDKKLDEEQTVLLSYYNDDDNIKKIIYDFENYMVKYNLNFTTDEVEYFIEEWEEDTKETISDILQDIKKLKEKNVGNLIYQKKYYNSLLNNFYFSIIKLTLVNQLNIDYFRFLDNKLETFYNKHILNSYDISSQINNRLKEKILINWYKNKIQEINSTSSAQDLDESEYNLNFTKNNVISNNINDYNTIINDNIIPETFSSDLELSFSFGKEIYQNTINQTNKISALLSDSLKINYLVIKSLINILYNPDCKLILFLKYSYNSNITEKVGDQSLIFSEDTNWNRYYEKIFNLYDENNNKFLITDFNLPIKNLLETKFAQFRSNLDSIMKSITVISSDNSNNFFRFLEFVNRRINEGAGNARFDNTSVYPDGYNFSNSADLSILSDIHFNLNDSSSGSYTSTYVNAYSNNMIFIDFNSFIYLNIQNKDGDPMNYIDSNGGATYLQNIHTSIYNHLENQIKNSDVSDLASIKSNSNDVFTFLCSVIDFNQLFTVENIVDTYVKNIASYKYILNIDPNLIGQKTDSKHILKIIKKYTIDSNWYNVIYQNNNTIIKIYNLFSNRSFCPDIFASYKLVINDIDYQIKIFKGNYPYQGSDLLEFTIDGTINEIQKIILVSEKSNIITLNSNLNYYSSLYLINNKLVIETISDVLIKDSLIEDIELEISLDSNLLTEDLIEKSDTIFYNRDVISQYLNLSYNQTYINLFDEKIYPLLKAKILEIAKTYKYYQLVSINQNVLDAYKNFFDEFVTELSETVGISSYNFYDLISKKNEKLSMERISRDLNNTTELISKGNINGNTNPTNIIERDMENTTNPPLFEYELVEDDTIIVTNDSITYNYNVTSISPTQIILDQKFNFDQNDVAISKETKFINYGGGYKISNSNDQYLITGLIPIIDYATSLGSTSYDANQKLNISITNYDKANNSIIQIVPYVKKSNLQIKGIDSKSLTLSADPNTEFEINQKIFTKDKELIGVINTIVSNDFVINLKKNIDLPTGTINIDDYLYHGITSLRKVTQVTNSDLTVEERFLNTITNIKQVSNIIPSENGNNNLYLDSVFRNIIAVNLNITNNSNLLTDVTVSADANTATQVTYQAVNPKDAIPEYSHTISDNDKIVIYGVNDVFKYDSSYIDSTGNTQTITFQSYDSVTKTLEFSHQVNNILGLNTQIYNSNDQLLGIIRSYDSNNTKVVLDENGLLQTLNTGDSIFRKVNINGMYSVDNTNNSTFELKTTDNNQNFYKWLD